MEEGPARKAGIAVGDILVTLNNVPMDSPEAFAQAVAELPETGTVAALVNREGNPRFLPLKLQ